MYWIALLLASAGLAYGLPSLQNQQPLSTEDFVTASTIRDTLLANSIIHEVLDDFEPLYYIDIKYPKHHETVLLGNDIPVKSVSKRPTFAFHSLAPPSGMMASDSTFTLILTDPDALSRDDPKMSEMCHWIITNLTTPIAEPQPPQTMKKKLPGELMSYYPPGPPPKTGAHRYVFVLLQGNTENISAPKERPHWGYGKVRHGVRDWAHDNNLTVVGANFFFAQNKKQ